MNDEEIVRDSFADYMNSLMDLKMAVQDLKRQMNSANKAIENVMTHTHLAAMLKLTGNSELLRTLNKNKP